ncbi:MAG: flagellar type III secretion system protein FlhB [Gammaproteobacteria bacterium]|nr:flagellar type III secretion system protein FlhB [Gammaproteobacteria bacterium]
MAEESASEKEHAPSGKRIEELRKQGQTLRSRDLSGGLVFLTVILSLIYLSQPLERQFLDNFKLAFAAIKDVLHEPDFPGKIITKLAVENFILIMPALILSMIAALASPFLFGGWNFSMSAVEFKFDKLNPTKFIKNILSKRIYLEVLRALIKVIIIFGVMLFFIFDNEHYFDQLAMVNPKRAIYGGFALVEKFTVVICMALVVVVIFDIIYHYFEYQQRIKMTTQELKDESKESDGNPEVKRKIRSRQYSLLRQQLNTTVPRADVIVTNPTHYAIALSYDDKKNSAPKIVAKGKGYIAQQIRQLAVANAVPIYQAPELARAIYHTGNIGAEIHPDLYMAVAIVLSYVHQLKSYQQGYGQAPNHVSDLKIPEELIFDE